MIHADTGRAQLSKLSIFFDFSTTLCYKYPLFFRHGLYGRWRKRQIGTQMKCAVGMLVTAIVFLIMSAQMVVAASFEDELLELINTYRASRKLNVLVKSPRYVDLAREHSQAMREQDRMSHDGFDERFRRATDAVSCVENVGWNHQTPQSLFAGWKKSPGHNRNMLKPRISRAGISKDGTYVTFFACQ